jgi:radical SAM superfamily enzyme YgiQ (UPF0313 family)
MAACCVALSGEVVSDYVRFIEDALGPTKLWIAAYSNDVYGYLPSARVLRSLSRRSFAAHAPPEYRVTICDENAGERVDYDTPAQIVGITGYLLQKIDVLTHAEQFRKRGKTVVVGGPLANLLPEVCRPYCDVLFEGEAEYTWPRFLRDYAGGHWDDRYVESEKIHLPDSPPPRLDLLRRRYAHGIVQCTRGCPFTCEFCDIIVMYGRKMRYKPVPQVLKEIEAWQARGVGKVFFADDNFIGNRAYAKELLLEEVRAEVTERLAKLGFDGSTEEAMRAWAGRENLEERLRENRIDPVLLRALREAT